MKYAEGPWKTRLIKHMRFQDDFIQQDLITVVLTGSTVILLRMRMLVSPCLPIGSAVHLCCCVACVVVLPVQVCSLCKSVACASVCSSASVCRDRPALCHHFIAEAARPPSLKLPAAQAGLHSTLPYLCHLCPHCPLSLGPNWVPTVSEIIT